MDSLLDLGGPLSPPNGQSMSQSSAADLLGDLNLGGTTTSSQLSQPMSQPFSSPPPFGQMAGNPSEPPALESLNIALTSIRPSTSFVPCMRVLEYRTDSAVCCAGSIPPICAYDKNGLRVVLHIAQDRPHPAVLVVVVSFLNLTPAPMNGFLFQAAVPKVPHHTAACVRSILLNIIDISFFPPLAIEGAPTTAVCG